MKTRGNKLHSQIQKLLIVFGIGKNCHCSGWNPLSHRFITRVTKLNVVIVQGYQYYELHVKAHPIFLSHGELHT
jgi:hypothetical protein